jgi:hypothetical protein
MTTPTKRILCTGHMEPEQAAVITIRLPMSLTPTAFVAYLRELLPAPIAIIGADMSQRQFVEFKLTINDPTFDAWQAEGAPMIGFSNTALDEAKATNVYDLFERE